MSIPVFILRSLKLSVPVFLRFLPFLVLSVLTVVGLFLSTQNIIVLAMILFILLTYGLSLLMVITIRGGLVVLGATTPPTAEGLLIAALRMLIFHILLPVLIGIFFVILISVAFYFVIQTVNGPEVVAELRAVLSERDPAARVAALPETLELFERIWGVVLAYTISFYLVGALIIGLIGVPMAAVSANAVRQSPKHDLLYGAGHNLPHQMVLNLLVVALPQITLSVLRPEYYLGGGAALTENDLILALGIVFWTIYGQCITAAGMALSYDDLRSRKAQARAEAVRPIVDTATEQQSLRSLRQERTPDANRAAVYDPRRSRGSPDR